MVFSTSTLFCNQILEYFFFKFFFTVKKKNFQRLMFTPKLNEFYAVRSHHLSSSCKNHSIKFCAAAASRPWRKKTLFRGSQWRTTREYTTGHLMILVWICDLWARDLSGQHDIKARVMLLLPYSIYDFGKQFYSFIWLLLEKSSFFLRFVFQTLFSPVLF